MLNIPDAIKALYLADSRPDIRKNFRVSFPNGELPDICNDQILSESVQLTESIMSQSTFKFGLAEAPQITFETIGVANMLGMTIECYHEIETTSLSAADIAAIQAGTWDGELVLAADSDLGYGFFRIPLGSFIVDSCPRNHGAMTHRKVTAVAPSTVSDYSVKFHFENWKAEHYYMTGTMTFDLAKWIYSVLGIELFGVTVTPTDYTFTGAVSESTLVSQTQLPVTVSLKLLTKLASTPAGSVFSFSIPELRSQEDIMQDFDTAWSSLVGSGFDKDLFTPYVEDVAAWGDSVTDSCDLSLHAYKFILGTVPFPEYYPLNNKESGELFYTYEENLGTVGIRVPVGLRLQRGSSTQDILIYDVGEDPTYTLYTFSAAGPTYVLEPTAEQHPSYDYYSYSGAFEYAKAVNGALEICGMFSQNGRNKFARQIVLDDSSPYSLTPGMYADMWYDEYDVDKIGQIFYDYVDVDKNAQEVIYYSSSGGNSVYDLKGNFVLNNVPTTMSAAESMITNYFMPNIDTVVFTPVELTAKGLPWLEAGDALEITTEDGEIVETYILERTLSGIVHLTDDIKSTGGTLISVEVTE